MSFLDNLENSLKSLETSEEGRASLENEHRLRERQRTAAQAAAPYAEELKKGPFTSALLRDAARVGHAQRTKINAVWIGLVLRLEARGKRLELRPTADGIVAAQIENGQETSVAPLDLKCDTGQWLRDWLGDPPPPAAPDPHEEAEF
jgi:hypothetical protein